LDSVHHGGATPTGEYVHTLQFVDVAAGWSERIAVLGRSQLVVLSFGHEFGQLGEEN